MSLDLDPSNSNRQYPDLSDSRTWDIHIGSVYRLNSGIKNRNNFFAWAIFLIQKVGTDSVIYANSGDILRGWRLYAWMFDSQNHPDFYADQFHI